MGLISKKSEFIDRVSKMKAPKIQDSSDNGYENLAFYVYDTKNFADRFTTNSIRWRWKGRYPEKLEDYYKREAKFRKKIEHWFNCAVANVL